MPISSENRERLAWWVTLQCAENLGPATFHRLVSHFGSPKNALEKVSAESLQGVPGADSELLKSLKYAAVRIDYCRDLVERLLRRHVEIIAYDAPGYPSALQKLKWPPPILYMRGEYNETADSRSVGIIGSTHPLARSFRTAYRCARALVRRNYTIVSGNAHGIDTAAHLGALDEKGRTIFVLPTGITHFRCAKEIPLTKAEKHGIIVSERPPEAPWETTGAIARNRVTAAFSRCLFIAEAKAEGGTMNTFENARKLGIPVFAALYGEETPEGNLLAISEGATGVRTVAELLEAVDSSGGTNAEEQKTFDLD